MPRAHRAHAEWTPSRLIAWAEQTGPATGRLVAGILERRPHPEQGYRACLGLMRLGRRPRRRSPRSRVSPRRAAPLLSLSHRRAHSHSTSRTGSRSTSGACPSGADARESARRRLLYEEAYADPPHD